MGGPSPAAILACTVPLIAVDQARKLHSGERMGLVPMATWADVGPSDMRYEGLG